MVYKKNSCKNNVNRHLTALKWFCVSTMVCIQCQFFLDNMYKLQVVPVHIKSKESLSENMSSVPNTRLRTIHPVLQIQ